MRMVLLRLGIIILLFMILGFFSNIEFMKSYKQAKKESGLTLITVSIMTYVLETYTCPFSYSKDAFREQFSERLSKAYNQMLSKDGYVHTYTARCLIEGQQFSIEVCTTDTDKQCRKNIGLFSD